MNYDIFISYRREGGEFIAKHIYDSLVKKGYRVFLDIESLRSGNFNHQLYSVIDSCKDLVVVLSPSALDRCVNPGDWVTNELAHAISQNKNIIPLITRGFQWPQQLPDSLSNLPYFEGVEASTEYFDASMERLERLLLSTKTAAGNQRAKTSEGSLEAMLENCCSYVREIKFALESKDCSVFSEAVSESERLILELEAYAVPLKLSDRESYQAVKKIKQLWEDFLENYVTGGVADTVFEAPGRRENALEDINDLIDLFLLELSADKKERKAFREDEQAIRKEFEKKCLPLKSKGKLPVWISFLIFVAFLTYWILFSSMGLIRFDVGHTILGVVFLIFDLFTVFYFIGSNEVHLRSVSEEKIYSPKKSREEMCEQIQAAYEKAFSEQQKKVPRRVKKSLVFCAVLAVLAFLLLYTARL